MYFFHRQKCNIFKKHVQNLETEPQMNHLGYMDISLALGLIANAKH